MCLNTATGFDKSEDRNTPTRALFFNLLGEVQDRAFEGQFCPASGLNLLIRAIACWNKLCLEPSFAEPDREGIATPPDVIKHVAPPGWQHASLTGDYIRTPTDSQDHRPLQQETSTIAA